MSMDRTVLDCRTSYNDNDICVVYKENTSECKRRISYSYKTSSLLLSIRSKSKQAVNKRVRFAELISNIELTWFDFISAAVINNNHQPSIPHKLLFNSPPPVIM